MGAPLADGLISGRAYGACLFSVCRVRDDESQVISRNSGSLQRDQVKERVGRDTGDQSQGWETLGCRPT